MSATASQQEHLFHRYPLGVWVEKFLAGMVTYMVYASLVHASDLFRHFRFADVRFLLSSRMSEEALQQVTCPSGYSAWAERFNPMPGCKADLSLAMDAAEPTIYSLLIAGSAGLVFVLVRKARDAGVTLTLPWDAQRPDLQAFNNTPTSRARLWQLVRPHPPLVRPLHQGIHRWVETSLVAHIGLSLFVLLHLLWRTLVHPRHLPQKWELPVCETAQWWQPQWLHYWSPAAYGCVTSWKIVAQAVLLAFNALVAVGLNTLAWFLLRREIEIDGFTW